jgi:hypothetical protein
VLLETPSDLNRVNSFLNLRVADIWACYKQWGEKERSFLPSLSTITVGSGAATCVIPTATLSRSANILKRPSNVLKTPVNLPRDERVSRYESSDLRSVDVRAQDLHDRVAGQPASSQDAILCCDVMRTLFNPLAGDLVVRDTDAGCELELTVKYAIPRPEWGTWR